MNIATMFGFQIFADIVLCLAIIVLLTIILREIKKKPSGVGPDSLEAFRKLIEESQHSADYLFRTIDEGRQSLKEMARILDDKERRLLKLVEEWEGMPGATHHIPLVADEGITTGSSKYETVIKMARQGLSERDMATALNIPEGEIHLIVGLDRQKIENA